MFILYMCVWESKAILIKIKLREINEREAKGNYKYNRETYPTN